MLKLEKLHISGFKSFSDQTEVHFPDGITAVVGPNGCGKSNIGDALNWVLGEQSAKSLRGASMQDVIFNGSEGRKPKGLAEVSLHFHGAAGLPGVDSDRIVITRRLFRNGESEYLINGRKSRLRDIQDILREGRVGAQSYATIEQGRIDQILNAKPKDRRIIIEEAAGISGFKHKRRLAELKLEATQANLLRVNDIVLEVERQIGSLKRQAAKARRYQRLREELRAKEAIRFAARARQLDAELAARREAERQARDAEAASAARLALLEAELTGDRAALEEAESQVRTAAEALHQLELEIEREETRVRSCREKIAESESQERTLAAEIVALEARLAALDDETRLQREQRRIGALETAAAVADLDGAQREAEAAARGLQDQRARTEASRRAIFESLNRLSEARNARRAIEDARDRALSQAARLAEERVAAQAELDQASSQAKDLGEVAERQRAGVEEIRARLEGHEAEIREARRAHAADTEALAVAREQEKSAASRLRTLEDLGTRFSGVSDGVRMLVASGASRGIRSLGVVADYVEASREFEGAAEAYLQPLLPAVILEDDEAAGRAAAMLREQGAGRTLFLCRTQPSGALAVGVPSNGHLPLPPELHGDRRILGRLKDRIAMRAGDGYVSEKIGDAVLVDSFESALALHRIYPNVDYLSVEGEVVYASGMIAAGGRHVGDTGLLAHNRKTQEARAQLAEHAAAAAALQVRVADRREAVDRLDAEIVEYRRALDEAGKRRVEIDLRVQRTHDDGARLARRVEVLRQEIDALGFEASRLSTEAAEAAEATDRLEREHAALEAGLAAESAALEAAERAAAGIAERAATLRAAVAGLRERQASYDRECQRLDEVRAEIDGSIADSRAQREAAVARREESIALLAATETALAGHVEERFEVARRRTTCEEEATGRRLALIEKESAQKESREALDRDREASRVVEMERLRTETDRSHLDDLCRQELGLPAGDAAALAGEGFEAAEPAAVEAEIAELKGKIEAIGPVNLTAIEEFAGLEERHAHLTSQRKDLEEAMASLRESIKRINRTSRDRFVEAFERIRTSYQEIYRVLFNGGRADLVLEEGEDVLECGIDMVAQPPGKRLGHVSLLSGGEKAMSAIALLFAIFRFQPSPFCLLDEVDAALDELNVGRFTRMLKEYAGHTQFILITHNKRSMEAANLLYGVTMEEAGVSKLVSMRV